MKLESFVFTMSQTEENPAQVVLKTVSDLDELFWIQELITSLHQRYVEKPTWKLLALFDERRLEQALVHIVSTLSPVEVSTFRARANDIKSPNQFKIYEVTHRNLGTFKNIIWRGTKSWGCSFNSLVVTGPITSRKFKTVNDPDVQFATLSDFVEYFQNSSFRVCNGLCRLVKNQWYAKLIVKHGVACATKNPIFQYVRPTKHNQSTSVIQQLHTQVAKIDGERCSCHRCLVSSK